jgi:hypothetical protein
MLAAGLKPTLVDQRSQRKGEKESTALSVKGSIGQSGSCLSSAVAVTALWAIGRCVMPEGATEMKEVD